MYWGISIQTDKVNIAYSVHRAIRILLEHWRMRVHSSHEEEGARVKVRWSGKMIFQMR